MQKINSLLNQLDDIESNLGKGYEELKTKPARQKVIRESEEKLRQIQYRHHGLEMKNDRLRNRQAKKTGKIKLKGMMGFYRVALFY